MNPEIFAFDVTRTRNAQAIRDAAALGYLREEDDGLDVTAGRMRFWTLWRPRNLVTNDLNPAFGDHHYDYRELPASWGGRFHFVVFDPDYKLSGNTTDHQTGSGTLNADYGLDRDYKSVERLRSEHRLGMTECARVTKPGGYVLYKTMAQVVSGKKVWLDMQMRDVAEEWLTLRLVDQLYVVGHRKQPDRKCPTCKGTGVRTVGVYEVPHEACEGTGKTPFVQKHSASNVSVLQVYRRSR